MKSRLLLLASASLFTAQLHAAIPVPSVPDSGGTAGILALGLLVVVAMRRKFAK